MILAIRLAFVEVGSKGEREPRGAFKRVCTCAAAHSCDQGGTPEAT